MRKSIVYADSIPKLSADASINAHGASNPAPHASALPHRVASPTKIVASPATKIESSNLCRPRKNPTAARESASSRPRHGLHVGCTFCTITSRHVRKTCANFKRQPRQQNRDGVTSVCTLDFTLLMNPTENRRASVFGTEPAFLHVPVH